MVRTLSASFPPHLGLCIGADMRGTQRPLIVNSGIMHTPTQPHHPAQFIQGTPSLETEVSARLVEESQRKRSVLHSHISYTQFILSPHSVGAVARRRMKVQRPVLPQIPTNIRPFKAMDDMLGALLTFRISSITSLKQE